MTLTVVTPSDARPTPRTEGTSFVMTNLFGAFDEQRSGPQAFRVQQRAPILRAHFHEVDQFRVVLAGVGRLGRDQVATGVIHYTDAYTAYGPITTDEADGLDYLTLRRDATTGANFMPDARHERLGHRRGRRGGEHFTVRALDGSDEGAAVAELGRTSRGAVAYRVVCSARQSASLLTSKNALDGYAVVLTGSATLAERSLGSGSLVSFSDLRELSAVTGGSGGATLALLVFAGHS